MNARFWMLVCFWLGIIVMLPRKRKAHPAHKVWDSRKVVDMRTQANTLKHDNERKDRLAS